MIQTIPEGEFYSCTDAERLSCTSPAEAVEEYLESWATNGDTLRDLAEEHCPIRLTAYRRGVVDAASEARRMAEHLAEHAAEDWSECHGGPDGESDATPADIVALSEAMRPAIEAFYARLTPWGCEEVGSVELGEADVLELLGEEVR